MSAVKPILSEAPNVVPIKPALNKTDINTHTVWITRFEDADGNSFALVGYDAATREFEAQRRAAQELEIAKQVQARLFPQMLPHLPSLDYTGICIQAHEVGGDYYDFLDLGVT